MFTNYMHVSVGICMLKATNTSSKCKFDLDSHPNVSGLGDDCLITQEHGRLMEIYDNGVP